MPLQRRQHLPLHFLDVPRAELAAAQIGQRGQLDFSHFVHFDGDVEGGEGGEEGRGAVAAVAEGGEVAVEEGEGDGDDFAGEVEVVDDVEGPVADFLAPGGVEGGAGGRGGLREVWLGRVAGRTGRRRRRVVAGVVISIIVERLLLVPHGFQAVDDAAASQVADDVPADATFVILRIVGIRHGGGRRENDDESKSIDRLIDQRSS